MYAIARYAVIASDRATVAGRNFASAYAIDAHATSHINPNTIRSGAAGNLLHNTGKIVLGGMRRTPPKTTAAAKIIHPAASNLRVQSERSSHREVSIRAISTAAAG